MDKIRNVGIVDGGHGKKVEVVIWHDRLFYRIINAKTHESRAYYIPAFGKRGNGKSKRLHVEIWEYHNGPVPVGFTIHHKDFNADNNNIENLQCLSNEDHVKLHSRRWHQEHPGAAKEIFDKTRAQASMWRKTADGRKKLEETGKRVWEAVSERTFTCAACGREFKTRAIQSVVKYCCDNCRAAALRRKRKGIPVSDTAC
jgi:hypothetical protein